MVSTTVVGNTQIPSEFTEGYQPAKDLNSWVGEWKLTGYTEQIDSISKAMGLKTFKRLYLKSHEVKLKTNYSELENAMKFLCTIGRQYKREMFIKMSGDSFSDNDSFSGISSEVECLFDDEKGVLVSVCSGTYGKLLMARGILPNGNFGIKYLLTSLSGEKLEAIEQFSRSDGTSTN